MDNQHEKITGYRDLSQDEIDRMNGIKDLEAVCNSMIDEMKGSDADQRNVSLAATYLEIAFMYAVRSVAKPERKTT